MKVQIIVSHVNTDFDALASMVAAKKLYPNAQIVISNQQDDLVKRYLSIYRDQFEFIQHNLVDWSEVTELIMVDVASIQRIGNIKQQIDEKKLHITVYDHHPKNENTIKKDAGKIEMVGATVTLLVEEIKRRSIPITDFEATLFGLGIYTDTGSFTFKNTTSRDLHVASYLMEHHMNLEIVERFRDQTLLQEQQELLDELFIKSETLEIDGLEIVISSCQQQSFIGGLAAVTNKLLEIKGADAAITIVGMGKDVFVVGRANSNRITLLPLLNKWNGGGHKHAGSALIKKADYLHVFETVKTDLQLIMNPAITARDIMASPVKTVAPDTTMEKAGDLMYRYGHSGYPVVEKERVEGIITRRDLDKANHHGLGHAPVKAYMSTNVQTTGADRSLEEIQQMIIEHNIGRLPVIENDKIIGIITRTNIIKAIHEETYGEGQLDSTIELKDNIANEMKEQLPENIFSLLKDIGNVASKSSTTVYLIGGIVRDIILNRSNLDIDIVVEGDGIKLAEQLLEKYSGTIETHESFGTATWTHPSGVEIDIASSRLEYYDRPASLPEVELSTLERDVSRRDFTINAMAICLNARRFGKLFDPYGGQEDLHNKTIKVLHNLSFVEDPTRILRAVRFELRFGFLMDEQTEKLAVHSIEKITELSMDRIIKEIKQLFNECNAAKAIQRLFKLNFWQQFGVQQVNSKQSYLHAKQFDKIKSFFNKTPNWFIYILIPFYYEGNITNAKKFVIRKRDNKLLQEIKALKSKNITEIDNIEQIHRLLKTYSDQAILFLAANSTSAFQTFTKEYLQKRSNLQVYLTGGDLLDLGLKQGPLYSKVFLELEIAFLKEELKSKQEAIEWVKQFIKNN